LIRIQMFQVRARLERDTDGNTRAARIPAVVHVIPAVDIIDVHVVRLVPVISPILRIRIHGAEPIATVLEAPISAHHHEGKTINAEKVISAIVAAEIDVRNAVTVIAAALLPSAVLGIEVAGTMLRPAISLLALLNNLLLPRASLLHRPISLPLGLLPAASVLLLLLRVLLTGPVLLLPLRLLAAGPVLLLLLRVLPAGSVLLLPLRLLPAGSVLLLLLRVLLCGLGLLVRFAAIPVLVISLRVAKNTDSKNQQQNSCADHFHLSHGYCLVGSMYDGEAIGCPLLDRL